MKAPNASLQARLLAGLLAVAVGAGGLTAALAAWRAGHELDELLDAHLAQAAALLVVQHSGRLPHEDGQVLDAPSLHRYAQRAVFQVFHEGELVLRSSQAPATPLAELGPGMGEGFHTVARDGARWRVFATRGGSPDVIVLVGERDAARQEILSAVLRPLLGLGLTALLLLVALGAGVLRWGLAPLRALSRQLAERRPDQLAPLGLPGTPAELRPVLVALNALFARIHDLLQGERRLTADAAHELRTPIAAIRAQAQVAQCAQDEAARSHALTATLAGCDRAARLIDQLLMLARLEAAAAPPRAPLALAELARQAVADAAESPLNQGHDAAPGGSWQLRIEDGGPGLDAAGLARLGQRFQRGTDVAAAGSGLGRSIVRRIAALQGWQLRVDRSPALGGLRVRLSPEKSGG